MTDRVGGGSVLGTRAAQVTALVLGLGFVLPLVLAPCPALVDYPEHVQRCFFLFQWLRGGAPSPFYEPALHYTPNLAMELSVVPLSYLIGNDWAERLFAIFAAVLPCYGAALIQRQISGRWSAWSLIPAALVYNHVLEFGFTNYLAALGLALIGIAVHLRLSGATTGKRVGWALFFGFVVLTAHLGGFIVYAGSLIIIELSSLDYSNKAEFSGRVMRALLPGGAALILGVLIMLTIGRSAASADIRYYGISPKLGYLLHPLSDGTTTLGAAMQLTLDLAIVVLILVRGVRFDRRLLPATVFWASTILWFPFQYGKSGVFVDMRMGIVFALFLFAGTVPRFRSGRHRLVVGGLFFACAAFGWSQQVYKDSRANATYPQVEKDLSELPPKSMVFVLAPEALADMHEADWYPPLLHAPALSERQDLFVSNVFGDQQEQPVVIRGPYLNLYYQRFRDYRSEREWLSSDGATLSMALAALPSADLPPHCYLFKIGVPLQEDTRHMRVVSNQTAYSLYEIDPRMWRP